MSSKRTMLPASLRPRPSIQPLLLIWTMPPTLSTPVLANAHGLLLLLNLALPRADLQRTAAYRCLPASRGARRGSRGRRRVEITPGPKKIPKRPTRTTRMTRTMRTMRMARMARTTTMTRTTTMMGTTKTTKNATQRTATLPCVRTKASSGYNPHEGSSERPILARARMKTEIVTPPTLVHPPVGNAETSSPISLSFTG